MATRSRIGIWKNGTVVSVYCHWDGYLSNNGKILLEHYDDNKIQQLILLGDISSLRKEIGTKHPFSAFDSGGMSFEEYDMQFGDMCTFYGRDRGETDTDAVAHKDFESFLEYCDSCGAEYYYIFKDGKWHWGDMYGSNEHSNTLTVLTAESILAYESEMV